MTLFRKGRPTRESRFAELGSLIPPPGALPWRSTLGTVTTDSALRMSAVWAAHNLICDQVASLPVDEYRKLPNGERLEILSPSKLVSSPSMVVDDLTWRYQAVSSFLLHGGAAGIVTSVSSAGWPETIELIDASALDWQPPREPGGEWTIKLLNEQVRRWPEGPLWYVPGRTLPGSPVGISVIGYAQNRIALGLAAEGYGADWFGNGAHPSAILKSNREITQEQATTIKERFKAATKSREPIAMGLGVEYQAISVPANESQFLETIQASVADIARFFGMQPEMIGGSSGTGSSITYANIEQRFLHLRQVTLTPWIVRLERALSDVIPRPRYVKLNRDAAVAMDLLTRVRALDIQIRNGSVTVNEARRLDDRAPVEWGDVPGVTDPPTPVADPVEAPQ